MKILFMGTPEFAAEVLDEINNGKNEIVGAVTQPDKPRGRGYELSMSAVKKYALEKGKVYLISPYTYHETINTSDDFKRVIINFQFSEKKYTNHSCDKYTFYKMIYENIPAITGIDLKVEYFEKLIECINEFDTYGKTDLDLYKAVLTIIFDDITTYLNRTGKNIEKPLSGIKADDNSENVNRAKQTENFILGNLKNNITIEDLANYLHLSVRHTKRFINEHMNISFKDFVRNYRMNIAKTLLQNPDENSQEVARKVGYMSYTGFYNAFKSFTGMSPDEYQKSLES